MPVATNRKPALVERKREKAAYEEPLTLQFNLLPFRLSSRL